MTEPMPFDRAWRSSARCRSRPVSAIKPAVRRAIPALSDKQDTEYAKAISEGSRLKVTTGGIR